MKTLATHPDLVRAWLFALGGLPMPALPAAPQTIWLNSKHGMSYVRLGATGLMASRLALGCGRIRKSNLDCVEAALDAGVNLVLTAPNYGESETALASIRAKIDPFLTMMTTQFPCRRRCSVRPVRAAGARTRPLVAGAWVRADRPDALQSP